MSTLKAKITNKTKHNLPAALLENILSIISEFEDSMKEHSELGLCFVSNTEIQELNRKYFGNDKVTDILSFSNDFKSDNYLGELIINLDQISTNDEEVLQERLTKLLVHGTLHLLGYDHISSRDKILMTKREEQLLKQIIGVFEQNGE